VLLAFSITKERRPGAATYRLTAPPRPPVSAFSFRHSAICIMQFAFKQ